MHSFCVTGFTRDTHQYFMKASPVRPGDYIEFFAEINLLGALSACPDGDTSVTVGKEGTACFPLLVEIFAPPPGALEGWKPPEVSSYRGNHGIGCL
jgi:uncharacterized protein YcgI (DUF1989 family)